jgi:formate dehydrogenase subunit beta
LVDDPDQLANVNPFIPIMLSNAASLIPELVERYPQDRLGALLRPCEMRAFTEMTKHHTFVTDRFLTISVDCLGTLPADEYQWRAERKQARSASLTQEALQFARQGGILAYRYRSACQTCKSPQAKGADLNLHILGLPVRRHILVETDNIREIQALDIDSITDGAASLGLVKQHQRVIAKLQQQHQRTMERLRQTLSDYLPVDIEALVEQLSACAPCQACMDVCPICSVDYPFKDEKGRYLKEDVMRWMISCAGCGMCEQACESNLPLSTIFGHIREQLSQQFDYFPGRSKDEPLPL